MGRAAVFLYLLILHAALIFSVARPDFIAAQHWRIGLDAPEPSSYVKEMHRGHRAANRNRIDGRTTLLGDSHFQLMDVSRLNFPALNFGIGHDTARFIKQRAADYGLDKNQQPLILWAGQNDLRKREVGPVALDIEELIAVTNRPDLWVLTVPPVRDDAELNAKILALNGAIESACSEGCEVIDAYSALVDSDQQLDARFDSGDGIHLNAKGYGIVIGLLNAKRGIEDAE